MNRTNAPFRVKLLAAVIYLLPERMYQLLMHGLEGPGSVQIEGGPTGHVSALHLNKVNGASITNLTVMSVDAQEAIALDRAECGREPKRRWWQRKESK